MLEHFESLHRQFLIYELRQILGSEGFAARLWQSIAEELHYRLTDEIWGEETELSCVAPVTSLRDWVMESGGLDPLFLASADGSFLDDEGQVIPRDVEPKYSGSEQLAAYGLWFASVEFPSLGTPSESAHNEQGWTRDEVLGHRAECLMLAYQALCCAQHLAAGNPLADGVQTGAISIDSIEEIERQVASQIAKRAVSQRLDQKLKPFWLEHCRCAVRSGKTIERLNDLFQIPGCDPALMRIQPATLRRWATETGIRFKAGRPKIE